MDLNKILPKSYVAKLEKIKADYFESLPPKTFAVMVACDKCRKPFALKLDREQVSELVLQPDIRCNLCK